MKKILFTAILAIAITKLPSQVLHQIQTLYSNQDSATNITVIYKDVTLHVASYTAGFFVNNQKISVDSAQLLTCYFFEKRLQIDSMKLIRNVSNFILKVYLQPVKMEEISLFAVRSFNSEIIGMREIKNQNLGKDIPMLLQYQPSVQVSSDAGNGVGYTYLRIRGSDASRTNVSVNGVPINDAESHGTYWVNMPDLASSAASVQVQRGVGNSVNGNGALGASVNIQTASNDQSYLTMASSAGSFNTQKLTVAMGTGLLQNKWAAEIRLSGIHSDGYVDRAATNLQSYFGNIRYQHKNWKIMLLNFGGKENTYQAWWGVPIEKISDKNNLIAHYNRNAGYVYKNKADSLNLFNSDRRYNYYTYKNESDNYYQNHTHLYFNLLNKRNFNINTTFFYTRGKGYFEQFRYQDAVAKYGVQPWTVGTDTFFSSDVIRRRWLDNNLYGVNINLLKQWNKLNLKFGGSAQKYTGKHFGEIVWASLMPSVNYLQHYYDATGNKSEASIYAMLDKRIFKKGSVWIDLQARSLQHSGAGKDNDQQQINFHQNYTFFNPKVGFKLETSANSNLILKYGVSHKEPTRSDITDHGLNAILPKPEKLSDIEVLFNITGRKWNTQLNVFHMQYTNQLIPTGAINDVGNPLRKNVAKSFRRGLEVMSQYQINKNLSIGGNLAISANRISKIEIILPNYVTYVNDTLQYKNVAIAMSPSTLGAMHIQYETPKNLLFRLQSKYTGKQYLDNTQSENKSLSSTFFMDVLVQKKWSFKKNQKVTLQFQIYNLLNQKYANNGYTYQYVSGSVSNPELVQEVFVFPQATRNYLLGIVISL